MPLILDNIFVFLWRWVAHTFRLIRCRNWPIVTGTLDNVDCPDHGVYPYAEIHSCYKVGDEEFYSRVLRGFWYDDSAHDFARRFRRLKSLAVRYSPDNPGKSYVRDSDQSFR